MIKKYVINKISVTTMCLFLLLMFYLIPTNDIKTEVISDNKINENIIYLLDEDNYVSRVISYYDVNDIPKQIENKINILINGCDTCDNFYPLIPKNTKLKSIKVDKNNVYLDFSKEILNVSVYFEESMIESIIYTICEINGIDNIYITVEGKELRNLPNSLADLPYPLNKSYGINKEYNIINLNDITKTTIYFLKEKDNNKYYVPVTKVNNSNDKKINIIIGELKSGVNSQINLNSYLSENVVLEDYEIKDNKMNLVFNEYIFNDSINKTILEEVKYSISKSVFENYDVNSVSFSTKKDSNIDSINKK